MGQEIGSRLKASSEDAFDRLTLVFSLLFMGVVGVAANVTHQAWLGFILLPVPLLFCRLDTYRFLLLILAAYLLYFECFSPASNFLFFNVPDSILIVFLVLKLFNRSNVHSFTAPYSPLLLPLYLFIIDGFMMSIQPVLHYGLDFYVMRDIKNLVYFCLVLILCRRSEPTFNPGKLYRLLIFFIAFTAMHAVVILGEFLRTGNRPISWNEVFLADAILMAVALLPITADIATKRLLYVCLALCSFGLLATQTRGLWLSTLFSLAAYFIVRFLSSRNFKPAMVFKWILTGLVFILLGEFVLRLSLGVSIFNFIHDRMTAVRPQELIDPSSSLGYRIHESLVVWSKRSFFGHGSGARLYLFFTQLGMNKFINWWSIHSEYFEMLHKYGFLGLGLFLWFLAVALKRSYRIAKSGQAFVSAMGFVVMTTLLNHCLVSITSGYLVRENVMIYMVLMVGILERYFPRAPKKPVEP